MKKDSYAFLIPLIVGGLALIFGFVVWSIEIYRVTFLTALGEQYLAAVTLLLPLVAMVMFAAKRAFKDKTLVDVVKLYLGLIIFQPAGCHFRHLYRGLATERRILCLEPTLPV